MGVDILYFIDHDLPTDTPQIFYEEFKKRVCNTDVILHNVNKSPFRDINIKKNTWYILYLDGYSEFVLHYEVDNYEFHLEVYKKTVRIDNIDFNNKTAFDYLRWYHLIAYLKENKLEGRKWLKIPISIYKKYLKTIFHSQKLLLIADSSSYRHETLYGELIDENNGKSIDHIIELNKSFSSPCKIWKNEDAFGRPESDYWSNHEHEVDAFFIFDLNQY